MLAIVGSGLVSPFGLDAREHAFFVPALLPPPTGSPFKGPKDKPLQVEHCPWIGTAEPVATRMVLLAQRAVRDALAPLRDRDTGNLGVLLCTDRPRPGLSEVDVRQFEDELSRLVRPAFLARAWGSAGAFLELAAAEEQARRARAQGLLVVAVDSLVSAEYLTRFMERPPPVWLGWPPDDSSHLTGTLKFGPNKAVQT
jgi:hypothetical protein